jgi:DNA helicase-2/ATP-dependent DNA helicase PcrA
MATDPLSGLNPAQRQAVEAVRGPVCILAGAGTGKTRTITHRIANQIVTGVARADQVLAVTFTDRAAEQLRARLAGLGVPPVRAATFHAAAWAQLRHFWPRASGGAPLPEVLASKVPLLVPVARRLGVEPRDLAAEIEWAKARMLSPQAYVKAARGRTTPLAPDVLAEVYADYEAAKQAAGAIDYEDMLLRTAELLERDPESAATVRQRYRFLTVDEYQDVNPAQHALLRAWLGDRDELCVVGDDDQTIYSFTGASSTYLVGFSRDFPAAVTVRLTRNYRSTRQVLDLANRVLWTKPPDQRKRLTSGLPDGPPPRFVAYADDAEEVASVVEGCGKLIADGLPPGEIAVLYRVNAQSSSFEEALRDAGLPYTVRGDAGFFSRPEVRQALRLLAAARAAAPDVRDAPGGVELLPDRADRQVARVLREGLRHDPAREPQGGVARERWRNLEALIAAAARRAEAEPTIAFRAVVDDLLARSAAGSEAPAPTGAITLTTLHRAKGLEYDAVFLVACEEGLLPISHARGEEEIEEERRLLYVGVTRARQFLTLSWTRSRPGRGGRPQSRRPSRLLYGLGDGAPKATDKTEKPQRAQADGDRRRGALLDDLREDARPLAQELRAWRAARAKADEVPAFVVFGDRTLAALAVLAIERPPTAPDDLLGVPGLGPAKVGRYGAELLALLEQTRAA